jgi:YbgC/YbaW family acyl-CoA thioester hydrolase
VQVRFAETDAQGIAHNAAYLVWFEVARVEYLRAYAGGYQALRDRGVEALVLESFCRYRTPARFDDLLEIRTRCADIRGARLRRCRHAAADAGSCVARGRYPVRGAGGLAAAVTSAAFCPPPLCFGFGFGPTRSISGLERYVDSHTSW